MSIPNYKFQDTKQGIQINVNTINTDLDHLRDSFLHQGHEELIRDVLRRRPLGLSAAAAADLEDKQQSSSSSGIEKAVRRVFSMKAPSVSASATGTEFYRRLDHHEYDAVAVADEENTNMEIHTQKGNKILEACRRGKKKRKHYPIFNNLVSMRIDSFSGLTNGKVEEEAWDLLKETVVVNKKNGVGSNGQPTTSTVMIN
ncbi:hypothetical protein GQ457_16G008460 [Hibiscus cannabinus]